MAGIRASPYGKVEKAEPSTSLEDMMKEMLNGQRALQNDFKEMNTRLERRIDGLGGKFSALDKNLVSLDARAKKLEHKSSSPSAVGSSGASTSASNSFDLKYITIKGWVEYAAWANDKTLGLTRDQAKDLADKIKVAAGEFSQLIGDVHMRGNTSYSFKLPVHGHAHDIVSVVRSADLGLDFDLKCSPQPTPWRQVMFPKMGRILNFVRSRVDKGRILDSWEPAWSIEVTDAEMKNVRMVASLTDGVTSWIESAPEILVFSSMVELRTQFARFRRIPPSSCISCATN